MPKYLVNPATKESICALVYVETSLPDELLILPPDCDTPALIVIVPPLAVAIVADPSVKAACLPLAKSYAALTALGVAAVVVLVEDVELFN